MTPETLNYFSSRNISVEFNTLGHSDQLRAAYIAETADLVNATTVKLSQNIKTGCYRIYEPTIAHRNKFTGFEAFYSQETKFKIGVNADIASALFKSAEISSADVTSAVSYLALLDAELGSTTLPIILYLSGGLDSEFVARRLVAIGKTFTPVIFNWTDATGVIKNTEETESAFDFCTANGLTPIVKTVNIPELWNSLAFRQLAVDLQLLSPQLVTHAWMALLLAAELPNHRHLFGGEVRYLSNYATSSGEIANLVYLNKVSAGFSGAIYSAAGGGANDSNFGINLAFYLEGTWNIIMADFLGYQAGGPTSGNWAVPPIGTYEFNVNSINISGQFGATGAYVVSPSSPTGWYPASSGSVFSVSISGAGQVWATANLDVRSVANPGLIQSYSINFRIDNLQDGSGN